ncbi:MAG TPA: VOC family protein [Pedobacter sp.]
MQFRIARHTSGFEQILKFYIEILGLELLGKFENHNDYDGIFIGRTGMDWHLEFTRSNEEAVHIFDEDDLLVFYPSTRNEYEEIISRFQQHGLTDIPPKNPYWAENGTTYKDPDGHLIVISPIKIS